MPTTLSLSPLPVERMLHAQEDMAAHLANPSHATPHYIDRTGQNVFQLYFNLYPSNNQDQIVKLAINDSLLVELILVQHTNRGEVYHLLPAAAPLLRHVLRNEVLGVRAAPRKKEQGVSFDEGSLRFIVDGKPIPQTHLTDLEHRLLKYLYKNTEKVCSYRDIAKHVWRGWAKDNTISQRICKLGKKLNQISLGARERYIKTSQSYVRGYMLTCET